MSIHTSLYDIERDAVSTFVVQKERKGYTVQAVLPSEELFAVTGHHDETMAKLLCCKYKKQLDDAMALPRGFARREPYPA